MQILEPIAPLYTDGQFIDKELRVPFEQLIKSKVVDNPPDHEFGILLDPHTGIPLPDHTGGVCPSHAPLRFILERLNNWHPIYAVVFDQSYHRKHKLKPREQRVEKVRFLKENNVDSFYYNSHAPFLFCSNRAGVIEEIRIRLAQAGIPKTRYDA